LVTRWTPETINAHLAQVESGARSMREFKQQLAWEIVSIFHGDDAANQAAADARKMHEGEAPSDAPVFHLTREVALIELLQQTGLVQSKSEGRRLIQQNGVRLNGDIVTDVDAVIQPAAHQGQTLRAGKRNYVRLSA
jgi:tyrosyl-tRNA synthetase